MVSIVNITENEKVRLSNAAIRSHDEIVGIAFRKDHIGINLPPWGEETVTQIDGIPVQYMKVYDQDLSFNTAFSFRASEQVDERYRQVFQGERQTGPVPEPIPCLRCAHDVLRGGISLGHFLVTAGTLGGIVYHNGTLRWEILSNHHVIATDRGQRGDAIYQPGNADATELEWKQRKVAQLHRWVPIIRADSDIPFDRNTAPNRLDCAVAVPSSNLKDRGITLSRSVIDPIGFPRGVKEPEVGMQVMKIGRTTGETHGEITSIDYAFRINAGTSLAADFRNTIETTPMVAGGDSGSLLVETSTRMVVGLLFGGVQERGIPTGHSIACNITQVAEALDISMIRPAGQTALPLPGIDSNPVLGGLLTGLAHGFLV